MKFHLRSTICFPTLRRSCIDSPSTRYRRFVCSVYGWRTCVIQNDERISPRICSNYFQFVWQSVKSLDAYRFWEHFSFRLSCARSLFLSLLRSLCTVVNISINFYLNSIWLLEIFHFEFMHICFWHRNAFGCGACCRFRTRNPIACNFILFYFILMPFVSRYFNKLPTECRRHRWSFHREDDTLPTMMKMTSFYAFRLVKMEKKERI